MAKKLDGEAEIERTCLVTRTAGDPDGLIRFVLGPGDEVVPDLRRKLPGRGVWVGGERTLVETAVRKRLFSRGFKTEAKAPEDLADRIDRLLEDATLAALGMARKAGQLVTGFGKVADAVERGEARAVIHAADGAPDGARKIGQAMRRREAREGGDLPAVIELFRSEQLGLALGGSNVIHAALLAGGASDSFLFRAGQLARYRSGGSDFGTAQMNASLDGVDEVADPDDGVRHASDIPTGTKAE
jgi:predicted RNA-binding protein YlxR (DUF448 family)